jgi:hypothetical protein
MPLECINDCIINIFVFVSYTVLKSQNSLDHGRRKKLMLETRTIHCYEPVFWIRIHGIRKFLGLPDPDLLVRCMVHDQSKIVQIFPEKMVRWQWTQCVTVPVCKYMYSTVYIRGSGSGSGSALGAGSASNSAEGIKLSHGGLATAHNGGAETLNGALHC